MAAYRRVDDLTVTCRLTACTPGSAPGPTLGVEYGKPLPFFMVVRRNNGPFPAADLERSVRPRVRAFQLCDDTVCSSTRPVRWSTCLGRARTACRCTADRHASSTAILALTTAAACPTSPTSSVAVRPTSPENAATSVRLHSLRDVFIMAALYNRGPLYFCPVVSFFFFYLLFFLA